MRRLVLHHQTQVGAWATSITLARREESGAMGPSQTALIELSWPGFLSGFFKRGGKLDYPNIFFLWGGGGGGGGAYSKHPKGGVWGHASQIILFF